MSRPFPGRPSPTPAIKVNGKIRAREVRVIAEDQKQLGILSLSEAINLARARGVDLVEVAPNANPPVCRLVDFGKYRYELAKREKESKKHQHANRVKEIQLSSQIDPHDFKVKLNHAIDFLCEETKVKITLRFRGRENIHKEFGFQQVRQFIDDLKPYAHPDSEPKLIGKNITVMLSPLPRSKRARNPNQVDQPAAASSPAAERPPQQHIEPLRPVPVQRPEAEPSAASQGGFVNNPFSQLQVGENA